MLLDETGILICELIHPFSRYKPDDKSSCLVGIIETWNPNVSKGSSQIKTKQISPIFGADAVQLYKSAIEAHPVTTAIKAQMRQKLCARFLF